MGDDWKTYWRNPGDAGGVPPSFDWSGSENLAAARILYPAPRRLSDKAGDTIGYKGGVVFPVELSATDSTQPIRLKLKLDFGICKDICVPTEALLALDIPAESDVGLPKELASALEDVPRVQSERRPSDPELKTWQADLAGEKPRLTFEARFPGGTQGADAFLDGPDGMFIPLPRKTGETGADLATFETDLTDGVDAADLKGRTLTLTLVGQAGQSEASLELE